MINQVVRLNEEQAQRVQSHKNEGTVPHLVFLEQWQLDMIVKGLKELTNWLPNEPECFETNQEYQEALDDIKDWQDIAENLEKEVFLVEIDGLKYQ